MGYCGSPLSRSLLGVKWTSPFALHMSASDPKRTFDMGTPLGRKSIDWNLRWLYLLTQHV
jgi:hypothetical protein